MNLELLATREEHLFDKFQTYIEAIDTSTLKPRVEKMYDDLNRELLVLKELLISEKDPAVKTDATDIVTNWLFMMSELNDHQHFVSVLLENIEGINKVLKNEEIKSKTDIVLLLEKIQPHTQTFSEFKDTMAMKVSQRDNGQLSNEEFSNQKMSYLFDLLDQLTDNLRSNFYGLD